MAALAYRIPALVLADLLGLSAHPTAHAAARLKVDYAAYECDAVKAKALAGCPSRKTEGTPMTDRPLDELGPVDYALVEFPVGQSNFTGEMAAELLALVDSGAIRVIDILILVPES